MNKLTLIIILLLAGGLANAQTVPIREGKPNADKLVVLKARLMLNPRSKKYNPDSARTMLEKEANKGSGEAMNALANLYNKGLGMPMDEKLAYAWYEKAAKAGYGKAWFNLGNMHKFGLGTPLDFKKAFECFSKGAEANDGSSFYGKGYMLYKGFGITQNYNEAVASFKKGSTLRNVASMYMLGLCYRNGYGIAQNADSAKFYLEKASKRGDGRAKEELSSLEPENINQVAITIPQPPANLAKPIRINQGFKEIKQRLPQNGLSGRYEGYIIKFDWSGQHIVSQTPLSLSLEQQGKKIKGFWEEARQETVAINATLADSALIFAQTSQSINDHYHQNKKLPISFEQGRLNLVQSQDTVYLSGNLRVYAPTQKEPEKPRMVMLWRTGELIKLPIVPADSVGLVAKEKEEEELDAQTLHFMAYPNPMATATTFKFTLRRPANIGITVTDVQNARTLYRLNKGMLQAGDYEVPLTLQGMPGNYLVTLQYNNKIKTLILNKY